MHSLAVTIDKARKLTRAIARMRTRMNARVCTCLLLGVTLLPGQAQAAGNDDGRAARAAGAADSVAPELAALAAAITPQVRKAYPQASTIEVHASAAALRLLPDCPAGLAADLQAQRLHGHLSARVRCAGTAGPSARLPVQVEVHVPMLVANGAIARGTLLDAGAVSVRELPLGNSSDYLTDAASAIGQRTRNSLRAGQPIGPRHLEAGDDVTAGQQVALAAGGPDFSVTVAGQALQNGRAGEQIRVRNLATGRVVAAWVTGRGRTHTRPPATPAGVR
jgi:flagella basal body P-ring formation protein FlgA